MQGELSLHFATPVWGREYTRVFCEVMLPCMLSPRNIPAIAAGARHVYKVYTSEAGRSEIEASPAWARLRSLVAVEILIVDTRDNKYGVSSDCYREALKAASALRAGALLLPPDIIIADGTINSLARLLANGKQAVLLTGVRTLKAGILPEVQARFARDGHICAPPRELVKVALRHLHPIAEAHMFDGDSEYYHPIGLFWKIADEGLLLHSFHLHPVAIRAPDAQVDFNGTIDDDMLEKARFADDAVYVLGDSDEALVLEVSDRDHVCPLPRRGGLESIVTSISLTTNAFHRKVVRVPMYVHSSGHAGPQWERAEQRARSVVATILDAVARMERLHAGTAPLHERLPWTLEKLRERSRRYLFPRAGVRQGSLPVVAVKLVGAACIVAGCAVLGLLGILQVKPAKRP